MTILSCPSFGFHEQAWWAIAVAVHSQCHPGKYASYLAFAMHPAMMIQQSPSGQQHRLDNDYNNAFQINNVGTNIRKPTTDYSLDDFHHVIATNLESAYHLCQLAQPLLVRAATSADATSEIVTRPPKKRNATIVFNSSVAGLVAIRSGTLYAASKGKESLMLLSLFQFSIAEAGSAHSPALMFLS